MEGGEKPEPRQRRGIRPSWGKLCVRARQGGGCLPAAFRMGMAGGTWPGSRELPPRATMEEGGEEGSEPEPPQTPGDPRALSSAFSPRTAPPAASAAAGIRTRFEAAAGRSGCPQGRCAGRPVSFTCRGGDRYECRSPGREPPRLAPLREVFSAVGWLGRPQPGAGRRGKFVRC